MDIVSQLTINGETREIADVQNRDDVAKVEVEIEELKNKIDYIAEQLDIVFQD